ncbi:hypothetical protein B0H14DRAFT_3445734 [Mycena olivaceomarginata]|nr:hypothetical protein B0H14DRAFT_3445734 [Mycena olivaceomarginata]
MSAPEDHLLSFTKNVTLSISIPGVALSVLLLGAIAYLQWNPVSRPYLDRVSFRLLVYALVGNVIFSSMVFFLTVKKTSTTCGVLAFLGMTSPTFSAGMFCCMALNLQLVLVFGVNGNKMEKFYVFSAVLLAGACNIPTWAAGEAGWYATNSTCWLRDPTPTEQLHWLLGTTTACILDVHDVLHPDPTDFNMNLRIANLCIYSLRPLLYVLLSGTDPSFIRACTQSPSSPTQTATRDPYGLTLMELGQEYNGTGDTEKATSSAEDNQRRPSTTEEALAEEELRSERVSHQL